MYHPKLAQFDRKLKALFDEIDDYLETKYGDRYTLHPARPPRGKTSNKAANGLFNVGADFSAGYGTSHGRGYVVNVSIATLEHIPKHIKQSILEDTAEKIDELLPKYFPDRKLTVEKSDDTFTIVGDFSLGTV